MVFLPDGLVFGAVDGGCGFLVGVEIFLFLVRLGLLNMFDRLLLRMRGRLLSVRLLSLDMLFAHLIDDGRLWLLLGCVDNRTETEVVRDFFVLLDFLLGQHIKHGLVLGLIAVVVVLLLLNLVFLSFMPLLRLCAFYALYRLLVVIDCWIAALLAHPVLKHSDPLQLGIHHFLNYNLNAPSLNLLEI